uniref:Hexosyltransferase n=1 Tax=Hirondellea gigas TaxID=1518452 RepID=A0A2P2I6G9_9CRUS
MRRSGAPTSLLHKVAHNFFYLGCCFGCFLLGSFLSLSTIDPSVCDLNLCTRRIQHMTADDSNEWLAYWDKHALGEPKKVFLVILILTAPKNFELRNVIRQTWLTDEGPDTLHYFVIGTEGLSDEFNVTIQSEQRRFSDLLLLGNIKDSYNTLSKKLLASLVYIHKNVQFRFLLKCDDDTYVQLHQLHYELKEVPYKQGVYWGFFDGRATPRRKGIWKEENWLLCDHYLPYALGGGYIISHDLVAFVARNSHYLQLYRSEDVSMGVWLAPIELHRIHDTKFDTEYRSRGCHNDYIVTHKQTPVSMRDKYNNLQTSGVMCKDLVQVRTSYNYNWNVLPSKCCVRNDTSIP